MSIRKTTESLLLYCEFYGMNTITVICDLYPNLKFQTKQKGITPVAESYMHEYLCSKIILMLKSNT